MGVTKAPFETFPDFADREAMESPYNEEFLAKCRAKAMEYDKEDIFLRGDLLSALQRSVPHHFRGMVFDGISFTYVR